MTHIFASPEVAATHKPRPTAKQQTPFTVEPGPNGRVCFIHTAIGLDKGIIRVPWYIIRTDPVASAIIELQSLFYSIEAERDGHLKQIDDLTTENVLLKRQIEEAANKAKHAERKASK